MPEEFQGRTWQKDPRSRPHRWGIDSLEGRQAGTMLQAFLALPPERAGHQAAWQFVLERHGGSVAQAAADWGETFGSVGEFREKGATGMVLNSVAYGRDHDAFTRKYMEQYYRVTGSALRRHDPNHLRLGVRHAADWNVHGAAVLGHYPSVREHVDVMSMNTYSDWPREAVDGYAQHFDMPILIGEFSWGGWIWEGQKYPPEWENDHEGWLQNEGCRRLARMFAHPQVVGYTWFKWYGGPDREKTAYAVVTDNLEVNRFNARMFRRVHPALEDVHAGTIAPEAV